MSLIFVSYRQIEHPTLLEDMHHEIVLIFIFLERRFIPVLSCC